MQLKVASLASPMSASGTLNSGRSVCCVHARTPVLLLRCSFINVLTLEELGRVHGTLEELGRGSFSVYHLLQLHVTYNYHYKNISEKLAVGSRTLGGWGLF